MFAAKTIRKILCGEPVLMIFNIIYMKNKAISLRLIIDYHIALYTARNGVTLGFRDAHVETLSTFIKTMPLYRANCSPDTDPISDYMG